MEERMNPFEKGPGALQALYGIGMYLAKSPVEQSLLNLIYYRVSQINGCAYLLDAWRETPFYSNRERAALAWAESLTKIKDGSVSDEVYSAAYKQFSEQEMVDLTLAVTTINTYNRINIAFRVQGGSYEPGMHVAPAN